MTYLGLGHLSVAVRHLCLKTEDMTSCRLSGVGEKGRQGSSAMGGVMERGGNWAQVSSFVRRNVWAKEALVVRGSEGTNHGYAHIFRIQQSTSGLGGW